MAAQSDSILIRFARREDCSSIMELKKELAAHSNMEHLPMLLSAKDLERDGFDVDPPCFQCIVADVQPTAGDDGSGESTTKAQDAGSNVVGYALYFFAYAAWEGKTLHLEDLCVSKNIRGGGIGSKMIKKLAKIALDQNCARIQLEVLDWNPARKFYDSHGGWNTTEGEGWHNFRMGKDEIKKLATS